MFTQAKAPCFSLLRSVWFGLIMGISGLAGWRVATHLALEQTRCLYCLDRNATSSGSAPMSVPYAVSLGKLEQHSHMSKCVCDPPFSNKPLVECFPFFRFFFSVSYLHNWLWRTQRFRVISTSEEECPMSICFICFFVCLSVGLFVSYV